MFAQDLAIATIMIGLLSILAFEAGRRVRANNKLLFISTILTTAGFSYLFQGNLGWANWVPSSSAVMLANFTPVLLALSAGIASHSMELRPRVRPVTVTLLSLVGIVCLFAPVIRPAFAPPKFSSVGEMNGVVVLQSHDATCAPASAATLLKLHGIDANEEEMAKLCLTSEFGTEALGLYRGLKIGCENHDCKVRIAGSDPYQWAAASQFPNVALVRFASDEYEQGIIAGEPTHSRYQPGWFSGVESGEDGHAVVLLSYKNGKWTVADPAIGLVTWNDSEFRARFTGDAIYIAK